MTAHQNEKGALSPETVSQLHAAGWSDEKILRAELRKIERDLKEIRDPWNRRTLGRRRREIKDALSDD